ncbi:JmjC domain, hydroxylase-domain-containing protein [Lipomyces oligophaga]|uniref:JmjC domain, hydroxylase-domain-containing protein n=1 Tax=Lipomyces oligophaga TaxID=45792 RepID=UPI0034CF32AE
MLNSHTDYSQTMAQFSSFPKFIKKINHYGMCVGIVKVIPPAEWSAALPGFTEEQIRSIRIKNPIVQHISQLKSGVYSQTNIEQARSYTIPQWRNLCEETNHQPPARRGERRADRNSHTASRKSFTKSGSKEDSEPPRKRMKDSDEFEGFDYRLDASEFTDERCAELEPAYWRSILYNNPLYGADMLGSLFTEKTKEWNVAHLENILNHLDQDVPGVNTAYLYFGMWKSTFAWHVEDMDLYSINYIHFGAPKQWYSISQSDSEKFFNLMRMTFPDEFKRCKEFLRHKTFNMSPTFLARSNIKVNKLVHRQGEFVITFPYGYHAGYNLGYNCAESVNFATEDWLHYGARAKICKCINDAVGIDVSELAKRVKTYKRTLRRQKFKEHEQDKQHIQSRESHISSSSSESTQPVVEDYIS